MNIPNIQKLEAALRTSQASDHFFLGSWFENMEGEPPAVAIHRCGTTACIAGWAQIVFDPTNDDYTGAQEVGQGMLELTDEQATELFTPWDIDADFYLATSIDAANVLAHLAKTGEVAWAEVCPHLVAPA